MKTKSRFRWTLAAANYAALAHGSPLLATGAPDVSSAVAAEVIVPDCPRLGLERHILFEAIRFELEHDGWSPVVLVRTRSPDARVTVEVTLSCLENETQARLSTYGSGAQVKSRPMQLGDLPHAVRTRAVALAVAELTRSATPSFNAGEEPQDPHTREATPLKPSEAADKSTGSTNQSWTTVRFSKVIGPTGTVVTRLPGELHAPMRAANSEWTLALGPAVRGFVPGPVPIYCGRIMVGWQWLRAAAEYLTADPLAANSSEEFGLLAGSIAINLLSTDYHQWRFTVGPGLMVGRAWSSQLNSMGSAIDGNAVVSTASSDSSKQSHLYLAGMVHGDAAIRVGWGWFVTAGLESGVTYGVARHGNTLSAESSVPLAAIGIYLMVGHEL